MEPAAGIEMALPEDPSVGRVARRLTRRLLIQWEMPDELVDKAILVASELASNAFLHGLPPFLLTVVGTGGAVRVGVRDSLALAPALRDYGSLASTGRGLRLVAVSSVCWGVVGGDHGKEVWASVSLASTGDDLAPMQIESPSPGPTESSKEACVVQFLQVPLDAYLALQEHNDGVFRECALLAVTDRELDSVPPALLFLAKRLNEHFAGTRDNYRDGVAAAQSQGQLTTDLERPCHPALAAEAVEASESYLAMMEQLDEFCRNQVLLAEPPSEAIVDIRRWFVTEMRSQLIDGRPPKPFQPAPRPPR